LNKPIVSFPKKAIEGVGPIEINSNEFLKRKNPKELDRTLFNREHEK